MGTPGTFRKDDLKKFADPIWKDRVLKLFQKAPFDINVHIVNGDENKKVVQASKYGINRVDTTDIKRYVGIQSKMWAEQIVGPLDTDGKITVILLQNEGTARVGMTPWMVGHRIAHTFLEANGREANVVLQRDGDQIQITLSRLFNELMKTRKKEGLFDIEGNDEFITEIGKLILPFRSARTGNLTHSGEISVELMTYYLTTGNVRFKRDWIAGPNFHRELTPLQQEILDYGWNPYKDGALAGRFEYFYEYPEYLDNLYTTMRSSKLRPRTKAKLRDEIKIMIDGELWDNKPNAAWTPSEVYHFHLTDAEKRLERLFQKMLNYTVGKIVVL